MDRSRLSSLILGIALLGFAFAFTHQVLAAGETPPKDNSKPSLSGAVYEAAAGDPDTTPVAHALIVVTRYNNAVDPFGNPNRPVAIATTDDEGQWSLPQVPVGNLVVTATAKGYLRDRTGRIHVGPGDHPSLVQRLVKAETEEDDRPGTLTGQVLRLTRPYWGDDTDEDDDDDDETDTDSLRSIARTVASADSVTTPTAFEPLAGAWVTSYRYPDTREPVDVNTLPVTGQAETGEDGRFAIAPLHPGLHLVVAQALRHRPTVDLAEIDPAETTDMEILIVRSGDNPSTFPAVLLYRSGRPGDDESAGWNAVDTDVFDAPLPGHRNGWLVLRARNNHNTFGFWESIDGWLHRIPESLYQVRFLVATDQSDPSKSPGVRLRVNSRSLQQCDILRISSLGDAGLAPTQEGRPYDLFFEPMDVNVFVPRGLDRMSLSFDLLNFDAGDAAEGEAILKSVQIDAHSVNRLQTLQALKEWTFDGGTEGWESRPDGAPYDNAEYDWADGALVLRVPTPGNTFGFWSSPTDGFTAPTSGTLLRASFTLRSNQSDPSLVPNLRVRLNNADFELSAEKVVVSRGDGRNSPDRSGKTYPVFFVVPPNAEGKPLYFALDVMAFDPQDAAGATLYVDKVAVDEVAFPAD